VSIRTARTTLGQVRRGLQVAHLLRQAPDASVQDRLAYRDQNFLWTVEHHILRHPGSPYHVLLDLAGYDLPRLTQLVGTRGLDAALDQLWTDGVYVRIEEFKGWRPIVRHGKSFRFAERDFANPTARDLFQMTSGGSRSRGTPINVPPEDLQQQSRQRRWLLAGYGLAGRDAVLWATPGMGLSLTLEYALGGRPPLRWFSPVASRVAQPILLRTARLASRIPLREPEVVPAARAIEVARFISRRNTPRGLIVETFTSPALRLVLAAAGENIPLGDVTFIVSGEPITARKRRQIEERGYRVLPRFAFNELGRIAWACTTAAEPDDVHVMTDMIAVRQYPRLLDDGRTTVAAYLFTTLLPYARNIMLNLESGDYGHLEQRACGCFLDRSGLRQHMHTIRSFEKLTAEGMTFAGPDLIELIEEVLPREFGGDSRHYQFVEAEDAGGFTRLYLLVSPELATVDADAVRRVTLRQIGSNNPFTQLVSGVWEAAGTIRVLRREPLSTPGGKILHLHRHRGLLEAL